MRMETLAILILNLFQYSASSNAEGQQNTNPSSRSYSNESYTGLTTERSVDFTIFSGYYTSPEERAENARLLSQGLQRENRVYFSIDSAREFENRNNPQAIEAAVYSSTRGAEDEHICESLESLNNMQFDDSSQYSDTPPLTPPRNESLSQNRSDVGSIALKNSKMLSTENSIEYKPVPGSILLEYREIEKEKMKQIHIKMSDGHKSYSVDISDIECLVEIVSKIIICDKAKETDNCKKNGNKEKEVAKNKQYFLVLDDLVYFDDLEDRVIENVKNIKIAESVNVFVPNMCKHSFEKCNVVSLIEPFFSVLRIIVGDCGCGINNFECSLNNTPFEMRTINNKRKERGEGRPIKITYISYPASDAFNLFRYLSKNINTYIYYLHVNLEDEMLIQLLNKMYLPEERQKRKTNSTTSTAPIGYLQVTNLVIHIKKKEFVKNKDKNTHKEEGKNKDNTKNSELKSLEDWICKYKKNMQTGNIDRIKTISMVFRKFSYLEKEHIALFLNMAVQDFLTEVRIEYAIKLENVKDKSIEAKADEILQIVKSAAKNLMSKDELIKKEEPNSDESPVNNIGVCFKMFKFDKASDRNMCDLKRFSLDFIIKSKEGSFSIKKSRCTEKSKLPSYIWINIEIYPDKNASSGAKIVQESQRSLEHSYRLAEHFARTHPMIYRPFNQQRLDNK
ncbi:hypothetical protein NEMIN01_1957 [Nematocida minor]|uniref:uncharacterized protein n=1 Tax=Nematocida minor TaxID=1912983 RepID=UPI00221E7B1D|nr:uncharacterized protein NEMIN01_1957 [Nematocida minor]KAI5192343.1 hypothetical protein NEMIN01_1957 [Nematocida minor]